MLDASFMVHALLDAPELLERELGTAGTEATAPHLLDAEVGHALRRRVAANQLDPVRAVSALRDLRDARITRFPHDVLMDRAWELRENLSFYDALYVSLAELLDETLLTLDERLAAAPGPRCVIEVS